MAEVTLPPPTAATLWRTFIGWTAGVPLIVAAAIAIVWGSWWVSGGQLMPATETAMIGVILLIAGVVLLYPFMLWVWASDLREGLRARRDWDAMTPEAQDAALAAQAAAASAAPLPRRKRRKAGAA